VNIPERKRETDGDDKNDHNESRCDDHDSSLTGRFRSDRFRAVDRRGRNVRTLHRWEAPSAIGAVDGVVRIFRLTFTGPHM